MDYVVATDTAETSELLAEYLNDVVTADDTVHALNSQIGGDETTSEDIRDGTDALDTFEETISDTVEFEQHQLVRGNQPAEDVLSYARDIDADEIVLSVGRRSPTGKALFGSVSQRLLLNAERPMRVVPREEP